MDKHTPTPWKVWPENGTAIATPITEVTLARCIKPEDAAFIVRAVNCHEELLKAMRKAIKRLRDGDGSDSFFPEQDHEAIEIMEQAIAKAEGK